MTLDQIIVDANESDWLLLSLSQYTDRGKIQWSATLRRDGPNRQPISRGRGNTAIQAVYEAYSGIDAAELEPETTVRREPTSELSKVYEDLSNFKLSSTVSWRR
jgi:hypothetical protein